MRFPDADSVKVRPQERAMAVQLIENLAESFDPSKYHDEYEDKLHEIIKAKAKGKKLDVASAREPEQTQVVDLVTRLQESLAASAGGKRPRGASKQEKAAAKSAARSTRRRTA
jgi:DNA end-binding protein Ku